MEVVTSWDTKKLPCTDVFPRRPTAEWTLGEDWTDYAVYYILDNLATTELEIILHSFAYYYDIDRPRGTIAHLDGKQLLCAIVQELSTVGDIGTRVFDLWKHKLQLAMCYFKNAVEEYSSSADFVHRLPRKYRSVISSRDDAKEMHWLESGEWGMDTWDIIPTDIDATPSGIRKAIALTMKNLGYACSELVAAVVWPIRLLEQVDAPITELEEQGVIAKRLYQITVHKVKYPIFGALTHELSPFYADGKLSSRKRRRIC